MHSVELFDGEFVGGVFDAGVLEGGGDVDGCGVDVFLDSGKCCV